MIKKQKELPYYIFVSGGDRLYLLGKDGNYLLNNDATEAMQFGEVIDAIIYIEKHGLEKLATVRKVKY